MSERRITAEEAREAYTVLIDECGARKDKNDVEAFIYHVTKEGCREYRFQGVLGFGGKFRNNGNRGGIPYVDCYHEDETSVRARAICRANVRLAEIFASIGGSRG